MINAYSLDFKRSKPVGCVMADDETIHWQAPIDFLSLVLIIAAGFQIGLQGFFGWNTIKWLFGRYETLVYDLIGLASVWQLCRQRFL